MRQNKSHFWLNILQQVFSNSNNSGREKLAKHHGRKWAFMLLHNMITQSLHCSAKCLDPFGSPGKNDEVAGKKGGGEESES